MELRFDPGLPLTDCTMKSKNLTSVDLSFAVCKMGVLWCLAEGVAVRIHRENLWKALRQRLAHGDHSG